jgi:hypothetical protein
MPDAERPFKLPCERLFAVTAFYFCNLLAFWTGWDTFSKLLLAILFGYIFLGFFSYTKEGQKMSLNVRSGLWLFPYYIGLGALSYFGSFGGGRDLMPFGWDFLYIFLFSLIIFYLAHISRMKPTKPFEKKTEELPVI